jgi:hypothetical protein
MAVMIVWSIYLKAPLEEPANPTDSPNPAKAPWYFLGLQEMLVYYDPWLAGVVLPSLIIVGLMAIPYIDVNPKGNGYFTFKERRWEITIFLVGFIVLWCTLIALGTACGAQLELFGPYDSGTSASSRALDNINLSEILWIKVLKGLPNFWLVRGSAWQSWASTSSPATDPLEDAVSALLRKMGMARYHRRQPRPDHALSTHQDVPALDLQPEVHREYPRVRVQHMTVGRRKTVDGRRGMGFVFRLTSPVCRPWSA